MAAVRHRKTVGEQSICGECGYSETSEVRKRNKVHCRRLANGKPLCDTCATRKKRKSMRLVFLNIYSLYQKFMEKERMNYSGPNSLIL